MVKAITVRRSEMTLPGGAAMTQLQLRVETAAVLLTASAGVDWNASSQRSLTLFNKYAGTKLDAKLAKAMKAAAKGPRAEPALPPT